MQNLELLQGETLRKSGSANHYIGREAVGGHLYLTDQRLAFVSHTYNAQVHTVSWMLPDIARVFRRNTLGFIPNGFCIATADEKLEVFVVWGRGAWIALIGK